MIIWSGVNSVFAKILFPSVRLLLLPDPLQSSLLFFVVAKHTAMRAGRDVAVVTPQWSSKEIFSILKVN